jgi:hypothetical protein
MTRRSHGPRYFRRPPATTPRDVADRLAAVRVRALELRLVAAVLAACWTVAAVDVLVAYRPGGPIDVAVGVAALMPAAVALAGVRWPPVARGDRGFAAMLILATGSLLVLIPSIADVVGQIGGRGVQTLLPSVEAAYPWVLGLIGTSLFAGFGIARRRLGESALRRRRVVRGIIVATFLAAGTAMVFAAVAAANELALRDRVAVSSRFGPTNVDGDPPLCDGDMTVGTTARVTMHLDATLDGHSLGAVDLSGDRSSSDVRWLAFVATSRQIGLYGQATVGHRSWVREPGVGWRAATSDEVYGDDLDRNAFDAALAKQARAAAETNGVSIVDGARARECSVAVDGPTFRNAFPETSWLVGDVDLGHWRGQLSYWVFLDGQIGRIEGTVNGDAANIQDGALQATIRVTLTAVDRGAPIVVAPPSG